MLIRFFKLLPLALLLVILLLVTSLSVFLLFSLGLSKTTLNILETLADEGGYRCVFIYSGSLLPVPVVSDGDGVVNRLVYNSFFNNSVIESLRGVRGVREVYPALLFHSAYYTGLAYNTTLEIKWVNRSVTVTMPLIIDEEVLAISTKALNYGCFPRPMYLSMGRLPGEGEFKVVLVDFWSHPKTELYAEDAKYAALLKMSEVISPGVKLTFYVPVLDVNDIALSLSDKSRLDAKFRANIRLDVSLGRYSIIPLNNTMAIDIGVAGIVRVVGLKEEEAFAPLLLDYTGLVKEMEALGFKVAELYNFIVVVLEEPSPVVAQSVINEIRFILSSSGYEGYKIFYRGTLVESYVSIFNYIFRIALVMSLSGVLSIALTTSLVTLAYVVRQRRIIGLLEVLGYTHSSILAVLVISVMLVTLLGLVLGYAIYYYDTDLFHVLWSKLRGYYREHALIIWPHWRDPSSWELLIISLLVVVVSTIATWLLLIIYLKLKSPSDLLR